MPNPEMGHRPEQSFASFDQLIDSLWSGPEAATIKEKIRNNDILIQSRLLEIERAKNIIKTYEADAETADNEAMIEKQKFEITCLMREIEGKPVEGTTEAEKEEFRKFFPDRMTDGEVEQAKKRLANLKIS